MSHLTRRLTAAVLTGVLALGGLAGCSKGPSFSMTDLPTELSWSSYQGQPVPVSKVDGPKHIEGVPAWGYSPTPQGAVLAAINGQTRIALAPDNVWPIVVRGLTAPGRGRDEFATLRTLQSITKPIDKKDARVFLGFQVKNWTWNKDKGEPISCAVLIAQRQGKHQFVYPVALAWLNDEWRIVLNESAEHIDAKPLKELDGYTLFPEQTKTSRK